MARQAALSAQHAVQEEQRTRRLGGDAGWASMEAREIAAGADVEVRRTVRGHGPALDGEQWVACTVTRQSEEKDREGHVRRLPGQFDVHVHDTRLGRAAGDADNDVGKVSYRDLRRVDLGGHTGVGEGHVAEGVPPRA